MGKLAGKIAVVTGASKGIGASIAKHRAAEGASIVVNYASDKEGAGLVVAEIKKAGGKAFAVQASVAVESEVVSLFEATAKSYGKVDILVNNAEGLQTSGLAGSEFEAQIIALTPLGRAGHPDDIAPVVAFLASEDAHWITGETLLVSGGAGI